MAKEFVGVVEHVEVLHFPVLTTVEEFEGLLDGLGGADVSGASGSR